MAIVDIALNLDPVDKLYRFSLSATGDLASVESFDTALVYSLLGERRATESEIAVAKHRRGWIGNTGQAVENGSKLWLFEQSRLTRSLLNDVKTEARAALLWLVDLGYLADVKAAASIEGGNIRLDISLELASTEIEQRYFMLWQNTGA